MLQNRPDYSGDHDLFVGGDDSNRDAALVGGYDVAAAGVSECVDLQAQELQAFTNPRTHFGSVFSDSAGED